MITLNFRSQACYRSFSDFVNYIFSQTICVRQAQGYCCVEYKLCADQTNPFTLDRITTATIMGLVDSSCIGDYVAIPGKSNFFQRLLNLVY